MLERTSRFVLEVVPYLLSALIAAIVIPGFLFSQPEGTKAVAVPYVSHAAIAAELAPSDRAAAAAHDMPTYR